MEQLQSLSTLTRLISVDFHTGRLAGGPSVQVLPRLRVVTDVERQDEAARVRPAQTVVHLRAQPQKKNAVHLHFAPLCRQIPSCVSKKDGRLQNLACRFTKSLCEWFFHLVQSFPRLAQVLDEIIVDGQAVVCAAQVQHQKAVLLEGVDLVEGGDGCSVVLHRADLQGENTVNSLGLTLLMKVVFVRNQWGSLSRKVASDDCSHNVSFYIFFNAIRHWCLKWLYKRQLSVSLHDETEATSHSGAGEHKQLCWAHIHATSGY